MNLQPLLPKDRVQQIRAISLQTGEPYHSAKVNWLNDPPDWKQLKGKELLTCYDSLLSLLSWPENKKLFILAQKTMQQFTASIRERLLNEPLLQEQLNGTRIPGTVLTGRFSYAITKWLWQEYGEQVQLHSSEASPETIRLFFQQLLPAMEYETITAGELNLSHRIKQLKGQIGSSSLGWLLDRLRQSELPNATKEFLFNELKIFVSWKTNLPGQHNGYLHLPVKKKAYHRPGLTSRNHTGILKQALPATTELSSVQQHQLVSIARASLVFLFRETDPFSFADPRTVKLFELEKGLGIALYSMLPGHRLSIESYIGYLVVKNGIPVAYGGGWIFGQRCQFGIHILEPFRGAESATIFLQLLRTYQQYFGVSRFVVKPYQFGHHNKEALYSGAFWFYYKLGFRPDNALLLQLAEQEWHKKKTDPSYRSPLPVLKKFTTANMVLQLGDRAVPEFDAALLSRAITQWINTICKGDREKAVQLAEQQTAKHLGKQLPRGWNHHERKNWQQWCLLAAACLSVQEWNAPEKKQFIQLIKTKDNREEPEFIRRLQQHRKCWLDLCRKFG